MHDISTPPPPPLCSYIRLRPCMTRSTSSPRRKPRRSVYSIVHSSQGIISNRILAFSLALWNSWSVHYGGTRTCCNSVYCRFAFVKEKTSASFSSRMGKATISPLRPVGVFFLQATHPREVGPAPRAARDLLTGNHGQRQHRRQREEGRRKGKGQGGGRGGGHPPPADGCGKVS